MLWKKSISSYVEGYRNKGFEFTDITEILAKKGFQTKDINKAIFMQKKAETCRDYIEKNLAKGFTPTEIKKMLTKTGWSEELIKKGFNEYNTINYMYIISFALTLIIIIASYLGASLASLIIGIILMMITLASYRYARKYLMELRSFRKITTDEKKDLVKKLEKEKKLEEKKLVQSVKSTKDVSEKEKKSKKKLKIVFFTVIAVILILAINFSIFFMDDFSLLIYLLIGIGIGILALFIINMLKKKSKKIAVDEKPKKQAADDDVKKVLEIADNLLEKLPPEVVDEFLKSEDFKLYEKVLTKYNIR